MTRDDIRNTLIDALASVAPEADFDALKPEGDSGFVHAGPVGAGHFAPLLVPTQINAMIDEYVGP